MADDKSLQNHRITSAEGKREGVMEAKQAGNRGGHKENKIFL